MSGHYVWCDPARCNERVHRSAKFDVWVPGGATFAHLYRVVGGQMFEPYLVIEALAAVPLSELRRVMSVVEALMAPRVAEEVTR